MTKLKVGIIGAGGMIAYWHIKPLQNAEYAQVTALCDQREEAVKKMADEFGIEKTFTDHKALIADDLDVVYVMTPHYLHRQMVLEALESGKHVICEKPFAMNAKEAEEMVTAAKKAGKRLFLSENFRYSPEIRKAKQLIEEGKMGKLFLCTSCFIGNEYERMTDPEHWKGTLDKSGGGVVIDNGVHMIDALYNLFGKVNSVYAEFKQAFTNNPKKGEDTAILSFEFASGLIADTTLTFVARHCGFLEGYMGAAIRIDIFGENGSLHILNEKENLITQIVGDEVNKFAPDALQKEYTLVPDMDFTECIVKDKEPLLPTEDGVEIMKIVDAVYRSAKSGTREKVQ